MCFCKWSDLQYFFSLFYYCVCVRMCYLIECSFVIYFSAISPRYIQALCIIQSLFSTEQCLDGYLGLNFKLAFIWSNLPWTWIGRVMTWWPLTFGDRVWVRGKWLESGDRGMIWKTRKQRTGGAKERGDNNCSGRLWPLLLFTPIFRHFQCVCVC